MALLFCDGYDHYSAYADLIQRAGAVQYNGSIVSGGPTSQGQGRNFNAKAWNGNLAGSTSQRLASHFIGATMQSANDVFVQFFDTVDNTYQIVVVFRVRNYSIEVWRGNQNTLLYRSANNVWTGNTGNFIEVWPVINNASGSVTIDVNGIQLVNITGQDTQQSPNAWWDRFEIYNAQVDDLYYCDTTAGAGTNPCNTFLGDPRVYTQFPTSDGTVAWTPKASTNWSQVSEVAFDGDATYNSSSTVGQQDIFNIGALPGTANTFLGVQVTVAARKDDAGARQINVVLKSGATTSTGTARNMTDTTYVYWSELFSVDPNTSASWTAANINASQPGYKMAA